MTHALERTVCRRTKDGWLAIRMCEQFEIARAIGITSDKARARLICKLLPLSGRMMFKDELKKYRPIK
jgi:hypothetical protein